MFPVFGLCVGAILVAVIRKRGIALGRMQSLSIILGWGLAFYIGQLVQMNLFGGLLEVTGDERTTKLIAIPLEAGLAGLIGTLFLKSQLGIDPNHRVSWKTVLATTLGFGLGNAISNVVYSSSTDVTFGQIFIWGLVSGASLGVPSKDFKRYLLLGALGGIGLYLAYQAFSASGTQLYAVFMGGVFGLFVGTATKKVPQTLVVILFAIMAFTIRGELTPWLLGLDIIKDDPIAKTITLALTAGLMGAVIGSAWSFLNSSKSTTSVERGAK